MNKELTIVITTFNRKERLITQLKSIFEQPLYIELYIIICDNCSDYDIDQVLGESFSSEELSVVEVIKRPFNIGMIGNISGAFLFPKTKWMWLLSDDDETSINSISTVLKNSHMYQDVLALKFTHISDSTKNEYKSYAVSSISEMMSSFKLHKIDLGNFIFMSNNVYNMNAIRPYLGSAFIHSYTYFPHMIPILMGINKGGVLQFIPDSIVNYKIPDNVASSNYLVSIYLGAMSISDIPFDLSANDFKDLSNFFKMNVFWEISNDFYNSSYLQKRFLYRKLYKSLYSGSWSLKNLLIYKIFDFQIYIGNNSISKFCFSIKELIRKIK